MSDLVANLLPHRQNTIGVFNSVENHPVLSMFFRKGVLATCNICYAMAGIRTKGNDYDNTCSKRNDLKNEIRIFSFLCQRKTRASGTGKGTLLLASV